MVHKCYNVSLKHLVMVVEAVVPEQPSPAKMEVQVILEDRESNELDPRVGYDRAIEPMEDVEEIILDESNLERKKKVGKNLKAEV